MGRVLIAAVVGVLLVVAAAVWWLKLDRGVLEVDVLAASNVGRHAKWDLTVRTTGYSGLRRVSAELAAAGKRYALFSEELPRTTVLGSGVREKRVTIESDLGALGVPEGPAALEVFAETYAWHLTAPPSGALVRHAVTLDLTPPSAELLTVQHNLRLGGVGVVVFRMTADTAQADVVVGDYVFSATRGYFADARAAFAVFAVPQDLSPDVRPAVRVSDAVGNTRAIEIPVRVRSWSFPEKTITIDDAFLHRKVPELLSMNGLPAAADPVQGYLQINRELRKTSEQRLRALTATSVPEPRWDGVFHRQSNSAPMSGFADRRTYVYQGQPIDQQTHLGYDLASVKRATIEAAQSGVVVFAGDLGIYGGTVVLDHGLGIFSLYGHLSSIAVQKGQQVGKAEALGQSGETGLAGGDHLHFSIMLHGIHVDPREWWDPNWLQDHVTEPLNLLPSVRAAAAASALARPSGGEATPPTGEPSRGEARP